MRVPIDDRVKSVKLRDIRQEDLGSCALLAAAPDNLLFRRVSGEKVAFKFYDRLTGAGEWVTVRGAWRESARESSKMIETAYGKWLERKNIFDSEGETGLKAVANGNSTYDVARDLTGVRDNFVEGLLPTTKLEELEQFNDRTRTAILATNPGSKSKYFLGDHAYRVLKAGNGKITTFNPWGKDGKTAFGDPNDGIMTITYQEFASNFSGDYCIF